MRVSNRFAASGLLALSLVPAAHAGDELYLRWDNCFGDGGVYNKVFACDTNSGSDVLVGSFRLAQTMDMSAIDGAVHVIPLLGGVPPSWWQYVRTGSCRKNSLVVSFAAPPASTACLDPWGGSPAVQGAFDYTNGAIIKYVAGVSAPLSFTLPAGQEFVAFQARIDHALTTGPAAGGLDRVA